VCVRVLVCVCVYMCVYVSISDRTSRAAVIGTLMCVKVLVSVHVKMCRAWPSAKGACLELKRVGLWPYTYSVHTNFRQDNRQL